MYKTKTLKDFAIGLGLLGALGLGGYIWQGCEQRAQEDKIYKESPYYRQIEELRQDAIKDGTYDVREVREAIDDAEREGRITAVEIAEINEWRRQNKSFMNDQTKTEKKK